MTDATNPTATDPATVEGRPGTFEHTPAAERDDVEGHGRFQISAEPTEGDDVEGHGRFQIEAEPTDEDDVEGHGRPYAL